MKRAGSQRSVVFIFLVAGAVAVAGCTSNPTLPGTDESDSTDPATLDDPGATRPDVAAAGNGGAAAPTDANGSAGADAGATGGHGGGTHIEMRDLKFSPATLTVQTGTTVSWTNHEAIEHTVTPADKAAWGSDGSGDRVADWLGEGASYAHTFSAAGTYVYYCIPHAAKNADGDWVGMVGTIVVTDEPVAPAGDEASGAHDDHGDGALDHAAPALDAVRIAHDAAAAKLQLPDSDGVVRVALEAREVLGIAADGATFPYWTFNGTVPGPMLRVREGDTVALTLSNHESNRLPHSIDLHAVTGPGGGATVTQLVPGANATFTFKAMHRGVFIYHCATAHVPSHIANGMYGLIVVEPPEGFPPVDKEFYIVQGELYTNERLGAAGALSFSLQDLLDERPTYYTFNGQANALTGEHALQASVGDTVRLFVGVGGFAPSSFHVIGEIFDTVYQEGAFPPVEHVQTTYVPAGGASIVEFALDVPGNYILVDHSLVRTLDRGALGILAVTGDDDPSVFRAGG